MTNKNYQTDYPSSELAIKEDAIFEPLTLEEEGERLILERRVERTFYQAGLALQTLRDQRLYRSTHKTFQEYCQERFNFSRSYSYRLITSVGIVDNIVKNVANWQQNSTEVLSIFPTAESQVRPLKALPSAELQSLAWSKAVTKAAGKVPSDKIVQVVVNQLKKQDQSTELENHSQSPNNGKTNKIRFVPLENPKIGQEVRICKNHPLFPHQKGIISQITHNRSVIVEFKNQKQSEPIDLRDLEIQRMVDKNGKVSTPSEGINYVPGVGVEWYVRVDEETWHKLDRYAKKIGTATLGNAIAQLLESELD
ncbi:MAG: hypothetical protein AB4372_18805 [Xenococcus sp. (in: cyanobacteria)]